MKLNVSNLSYPTDSLQLTPPEYGQSRANCAIMICQLESILSHHSATTSSHIFMVTKADGSQCGLRLELRDNMLLPEIGAILYIEVNPEPLCSTHYSVPTFTLLSWRQIISDYQLTQLETLFSSTAKPEALIRLLALIDRIRDKRLKQFITDVFGSQSIALPFIALPASRNHHHSYPGGLLQHSVECAEWLETLAHETLTPTEAELTITLALLHDLGKIETLTRSSTGQLVSHEVMSLTLLEPFLSQLQTTWKQGALALREMLGWAIASGKFPKLPGLLLVKMADQYSTALSARAMAFAGQPDYFYWACLRTPTSTQFFNRIS